MKIETDTRNKLSKIIAGETFSDRFTFLTELLQNSQRAQAKNVTIENHDGVFLFKDDGCGCDTPESVFTLDSSNWKTTDEGFGIGFMSIFAVPGLKKITVRSHAWKVTINMSDILNGDLSYDIVSDKSIKGFAVELESNWLKNDELEQHVIDNAKYISDFRTSYNGNFIATKSVLDDYSSSAFAIRVNRPSYEAIFEISRWGGIQVYYENRLVKETYNLVSGVAGVLVLKKAKGLLREPDRKEFVMDTKYFTLKEKIKKEANILYKEYVNRFGMDDLNYTDGIIKNLSYKEIEERLDISDLLGAIHTKKEKLLNESKEILETELISVDSFENVTIEKSDYSELNSVNTNHYSNFSQTTNTTMDTPLYNVAKTMELPGKVETRKKDMNEVFKELKTSFYVCASEVELYENLIAEAKYYGIQVFVSKNRLYDLLFQKRNSYHISTLKEHLQVQFVRKNVTIQNSKEETYLRMLTPICNKYNLDTKVFRIANLSMRVTFINDNGKVMLRKIIKNDKNNINLNGETDGFNIYLDRNMLNLKKYPIKKKRFAMPEYRCLLNSLGTVAHEMAHYLYKTQDNTLTHYKIEKEIYDNLIRTYNSIR